MHIVFFAHAVVIARAFGTFGARAGPSGRAGRRRSNCGCLRSSPVKMDRPSLAGTKVRTLRARACKRVTSRASWAEAKQAKESNRRASLAKSLQVRSRAASPEYDVSLATASYEYDVIAP